jgi:hypothetical protein
VLIAPPIPLAPARYQYNFVFDLKVHGEREAARDCGHGGTDAQPRRLRNPPSIG